MTTTQHTSTGARSRVSLASKLAALTSALVGMAAISAFVALPTARADAIGPLPHVEIAHQCVEGELRYEATMTNTGLGTTHFDVSVNSGSGATSHGYDVISGAIVVATFVVEQGSYGIFDVSNVDDATIVDHQQLKADCKAEPYAEIGVICPEDHSTPFVYLEWVNLSYAHEAYFDVYLDGVTVASGFSGAANTHLLSFDLVDGQHVAAAILADGIVVEEVNTDVDCPPASTTTQPTTTQPDTTQPDTTAPGSTLAEPPLPDTTQPDTTAPGSTLAEPPLPTITVADTTTSDTAIQPDSATTIQGAVAEQFPIASDHSDDGLPVTGGGSDALIAIALKVVFGGLGMVLLARRFR